MKLPSVKLPNINASGGRSAWAFLAVMGGAMVFTAINIWIIWMLRDHPGFLFYLGIAGHIQILVGMTALGWAMGRRLNVNAGRDGVTINDSQHIDVHQSGSE